MAKNDHRDADRRRLQAEQERFLARGGKVHVVPGFERVGTRGDRDNSHLFGYRLR